MALDCGVGSICRHRKDVGADSIRLSEPETDFPGCPTRHWPRNGRVDCAQANGFMLWEQTRLTVET